jgi:hypothetical protein
MAALFRRFDTGRHVAGATRRTQLSGPAPTAEDAVARLTTELRAPCRRRHGRGARRVIGFPCRRPPSFRG